MIRKILWIPVVLTTFFLKSQECPEPVYPLSNATGVAVDTTIEWTPVQGVTAYNISIGTSPNGTEIVSTTSTGQSTSFTPPRGLPENTTIYVRISLFILSQGATSCIEYSFTTEDVITPPDCTVMVSPQNRAENIPISSAIRWLYSPTATGYLLRIGTTPGGSQILADEQITDALQWNSNGLLLPETKYYIRIVPFNENGTAQACEDYFFTTGPEATLPDCPELIYPPDGQTNVSLNPIIRWSDVAGATGYRVFLGSPPFGNDIISGGVPITDTKIGVNRLSPNSEHLITISAFNEAGESIGCTQTSFFTLEGCGPFLDEDGDLIDLRPTTSFPDTVSICSNRNINRIFSSDPADGVRWYKIQSNGSLELLSQTDSLDITEPGNYRYELYETYTREYGELECSSYKDFVALISEAPIIEDTRVTFNNGTLNIDVIVRGNGTYVYAIAEANFDPATTTLSYQESNRFEDLPVTAYKIFVLDKNLCGSDEVEVRPDLSALGFPSFFTPNGDGVNDTWNYILNPLAGLPMSEILIYDRYGRLLYTVFPKTEGWNGEYRGKPMPESDYWFSAVSTTGETYKGHFALKR